MEPGLFGENLPKIHHTSIMDNKEMLMRLKSQGVKMYRGGKQMTDEEFSEFVSW